MIVFHLLLAGVVSFVSVTALLLAFHLAKKMTTSKRKTLQMRKCSSVVVQRKRVAVWESLQVNVATSAQYGSNPQKIQRSKNKTETSMI